MQVGRSVRVLHGGGGGGGVVVQGGKLLAGSTLQSMQSARCVGSHGSGTTVTAFGTTTTALRWAPVTGC